MKSLKDYVLTIPDFPKEGIMFRDVTSVLEDADGFALAINTLKEMLDGVDFDVVVGPESRGFVLGAPLAYIFHKPFVLVRKKGKLPREVIRQEYSLEYGTAELEMNKNSVKPGQKAVIVDDLIATGGTVEAACKMIEKMGGTVVKSVFLMELAGFEARKNLSCPVDSAIVYPDK